MTTKPQQPSETENTESPTMTDGPTISKKKKTRRPWEEKHRPFIHTYRNIPPEIHQEILDIAKQLKVSTGEVMRAFAEYGLAGQLLPLRVGAGYCCYCRIQQPPKLSRSVG